MKILCPQCQQPVPSSQINVATDFAMCPSCNQGFKPSQLMAPQENFSKTLLNPPAGCFYRHEAGQHVVGASTRSPIAFFLVPFMCVWSGGALGGLYGSQIAAGEFDPVRSIFGIPFILGSLLFWGLAIMAVAGRIEITIKDRQLSVFMGVGKLGWTRRISWAAVHTIQESVGGGRQPRTSISLEGDSRLTFGSNLNDARRYFVLNALRHIKSRG